MVVKRQCSFCAGEVEPGTGTMFVKRDGTVFYFCSASCRKQQLHLGRVGHRLKWTRAHAVKRAQEQSVAQRPERAAGRPAAPSAPRPKKAAPAAAPPSPVTPAIEPAAAAAASSRPAQAPAEKPAAKPAEKPAPAADEKGPPAKAPAKPRAKKPKAPAGSTKA